MSQWLFGGAFHGAAFGAQECSSRRVQGLWVEFGQEYQRTCFTPRAASDVDTGELKQELTGGFFGSRREIGFKAEEFTGLLEEVFVTVGTQTEMANTDKAAGQDME